VHRTKKKKMRDLPRLQNRDGVFNKRLSPNVGEGTVQNHKRGESYEHGSKRREGEGAKEGAERHGVRVLQEREEGA